MPANIIHRDPGFLGAVAKTAAGHATIPVTAPPVGGSDPISVASAAVLSEWQAEDAAGVAGIEGLAASVQGKAQNTDEAITDRDTSNAESFAAIEVRNA